VGINKNQEIHSKN